MEHTMNTNTPLLPLSSLLPDIRNLLTWTTRFTKRRLGFSVSFARLQTALITSAGPYGSARMGNCPHCNHTALHPVLVCIGLLAWLVKKDHPLAGLLIRPAA